jgi:putative phosphoribosyl transferase
VGARRIVLAVPLAPRDVLPEMRQLCEELLCLVSPEPFYAVGAHYGDFTQTEDVEVIRLLAEARKWASEKSA